MRQTLAPGVAKGDVVEKDAGAQEEDTQGGSGRSNQDAREVENDSEA